MKKLKVFYWIVTGLFLFFMFGSAIPDILSSHDAVAGFAKMGYPAYLLPFLGVAKALGVIAILIPGFPKIKEWAYAGLMFDLAGATYSIMSSVPGAAWLPMLIPVCLGIGSYILYQKKLKAVMVNDKNKSTNAGISNQYATNKIVHAAIA